MSPPSQTAIRTVVIPGAFADDSPRDRARRLLMEIRAASKATESKVITDDRR